MRKISRQRMIKKTMRGEYNVWKGKREVQTIPEPALREENYVISWWFRGEYCIKDGIIYLEESPSYSHENLYNPAEEKNLYLELANLDENSEEDIISFVDKNGLLEEHNKDTSPIHTPNFSPDGIYPAPRSEPVSFFQDQCRYIRGVLELCSLVKPQGKSTKHDYARVKELIKYLETAYSVLGKQFLEMIEQDKDENMVRAAQTYITSILFHLLKYVRISPEPDFQTRTFSECYRAEGLLPNIYLQVYWMLLKSEVRNCANPKCNEYFEPARRDQVFHNEPCRRRHQQRKRYHEDLEKKKGGKSKPPGKGSNPDGS